MNETCAYLGSIIVNAIVLFLFFKLIWPYMVNCISVIDSAVFSLLVGHLIKTKLVHVPIHPVFQILMYAGLFGVCFLLMHLKYSFIVSALFMTYVWTELIVGQISRHWESYDIIWGVFLSITTFGIIFFFHYKDYELLGN